MSGRLPAVHWHYPVVQLHVPWRRQLPVLPLCQPSRASGVLPVVAEVPVVVPLLPVLPASFHPVILASPAQHEYAQQTPVSAAHPED
ncbi:hypothetical protein [Escherichia Stx1 converting phage]|uniref:Uncharacterized protein n=2 Tax=Traversvirus TaxID=1981157 RepID=Q7Y2X7_9CAUD|nr:hypothetical protein Stx1_p004 [Escherichia Stx1 converting phage]NP_859249.1 hypothetical protein Stx2II_p004 [Escherichia phage Stx2 II]BAB87852.1 hypothetical protein [Stx2 converting phage I]BAC77819.1 hypothetical protein [Escherichia Stx1 converting phage]BAC77986.1 hypothetical protein [Escherichia phage Stx2 II]